MHKALLIVLLVLVVAAPAAAADPLITDPCGDLLVHGHVQGEPVTTPSDPYSAFDLAAATLTSVEGGVDASIAVCDDAVTPEHNQSYGVGWALGEQCRASVTLNRGLRGDVGSEDIQMDNDPRAAFEQMCTEPPKDGELFGTMTTVFRVELPETAWSIDGDSVTFTLRAAELPAAAAELLEPGTTWSTPYAMGRYLPASGAGSVFFHDAQGTASLRASDGADYAGTDQAFVVESVDS